MAHPSLYLVKFLYVTQEDPTLAGVNETLRSHGLHSLSEQDYTNTVKDLTPPSGFRLTDRSDRNSVNWLKRHGIYRLVHPDEAVREMETRILRNPRLRTDIESLLIGNVDPKEAAFRLHKLKRPVGELAIADFRHYFWNPDVMGVNDWVEYLQKDDSKRTRSVQQQFRTSLTGGPELALHRIGATREVDTKEALKEIHRELYFSFKEVQALPTDQKKVEMLSTIARSMVRIDERMQTGDSALQEVLKKFERFKHRANPDKVQSLFELAPSGSVSQRSRTEILTTREN